jgi:hypothetical protein
MELMELESNQSFAVFFGQGNTSVERELIQTIPTPRVMTGDGTISE